MSTKESQNPQNILVVAIVALVIIGLILGVLYLQTRNVLEQQRVVATTAAEQAAMLAETAASDISALESDGTTIADAATEIAAELDTLSADATTAAELAAAADATTTAELANLSADIALAEDTIKSQSVLSTSQAVSIAMQDRSATQNAEAAANAEATLQAQLSAVELESTQIAARATIAAGVAEADIASAQEEVDALATQVNDLSTGRDALQVTITAQEETASIQTDAIATQSVMLAELEAELSAQSTQIAELASGNAETGASDENSLLPAVGISADATTLIESRNEVTIDLTGEDNMIDSVAFDDTYINFIITADVAWGAGAEEDYCGFTFRRLNNDNYYTAEIDRRGEARFYTRVNGGWTLGSNATSESINTDTDALNNLVLVGQDQKFTLYINDEQVLVMEDDSNLVGRVTLAAGTFEGSDEAGCTFTDINVWELESVKTSDTITEPETVYAFSDIPASRAVDGAFVLGYDDAPITVIEFSDFMCPHCQNYHATVLEFIDLHVRTGEAKFEYRFFPTVDRNGVTPRIAECATGDDPARFWEVHEIMFELVKSGWTDDSVGVVAQRMDIGLDGLLSCLDTANQVETDIALGQSQSVSGTPAIRIRLGDNEPQVIGDYISGGVPLSALSEVVTNAQ